MRFKCEKTVQDTYNCVLQGLPLIHSLCVENWLSPFHCDLINGEVTVGVIRFSVFYWYDIPVPKFLSRCRTARFRIKGVKSFARNLFLTICFR